jgi:nicotinamide riboside kinase
MALVETESCDCYECVGSKTAYTEDGFEYVVNNLKRHTFHEPCENCGRLKTEYRDLGRKGYYACWWCTKRAKGNGRGVTD